PSDAAVALIALDAIVEVSSPGGMRRIPVEEFYLVPNHTPALENVMLPGELITALEIPAGPAQRNATYLKVRDRSSYEFALVSVAAGLEFDGDTIVRARLALGGVGTIPWRVRAAEEALAGKKADADAFRAAAAAAVEGAIPRRDNAFKVELAKRAVVRALETVVRERCRRKTESQRSGTLYGRYAGRARDLCGDRFEYDRARPDSLDRDRFRGDGPRRDQNLHPREHAAFHESGAGFSCRARPFADPDADAERGDRPLRAASRGRRRGDVRSRARRCGSRASRLRGAAAGRGASRSACAALETGYVFWRSHARRSRRRRHGIGGCRNPYRRDVHDADGIAQRDGAARHDRAMERQAARRPRTDAMDFGVAQLSRQGVRARSRRRPRHLSVRRRRIRLQGIRHAAQRARGDGRARDRPAGKTRAQSRASLHVGGKPRTDRAASARRGRRKRSAYGNRARRDDWRVGRRLVHRAARADDDVFVRLSQRPHPPRSRDAQPAR